MKLKNYWYYFFYEDGLLFGLRIYIFFFRYYFLFSLFKLNKFRSFSLSMKSVSQPLFFLGYFLVLNSLSFGDTKA